MDDETPKLPKRRAGRKAAKADDPFAPFEDWLEKGPKGDWPGPQSGREMSEDHARIVASNAKLLLEPELWTNKIQEFEDTLSTITDEHSRTAKRNEYAIHFDRHHFKLNSINCDNYIFPCSAIFSSVVFDVKEISFKRSKFMGASNYFDRAEFQNCSVIFDEADFGDGNLRVDDAIFVNAFVSFDDAIFGQSTTSLRGLVFDQTSFSMSGAVVRGNLNVRSEFTRSASFRRLVVEGAADFTGSRFAEVPDFRDIKLVHPPDVARLKVPAPKLVNSAWSLFKVAAVDEDAARYRTLKAMALAAHDHEKDGEFFSYEMLAKRGVETTGFFGLFFNTLYHCLGDFGQSYLRPLGWMGASFVAFLALYGAIIGKAGGWPANLWFIIEYSLRNTVPLFGSLFRFAPTFEGHQTSFQETFKAIEKAGVNIDWLTWLGIFQSLFGLVLLFLLLLALRNKFRLK